MSSSKVIKVAVMQLKVASNDKVKNFTECARQIRQAVADGCQLVALQELHATRYFCQQEIADNFDLAESLEGETYSAYQELAAELDVVLVISQFERRAAGLYHNTAQVIDGKLGKVGIFRKMHIPDDPGYYEKFYFTPGDAQGAFNGFAPVQTRLGKLAVLVCWDQWYPEAARLMALAGADLLIYPTAIGWDPRENQAEKNRQRDAWITIQRSHAIANGLPVLVANRTGFEADLCGIGPGIEFWGSSFVAGPQGELLIAAPVDQEGFFVAEINIARSETVRRMWPYLRDRRIDAYGGLTKRWLAD
jgi:N-carbamoylputrescine amidase